MSHLLPLTLALVHDGYTEDFCAFPFIVIGMFFGTIGLMWLFTKPLEFLQKKLPKCAAIFALVTLVGLLALIGGCCVGVVRLHTEFFGYP